MTINSIFQQTTFAVTIDSLQSLPNDSVYEVAFAGRSNSGKSTAINTICGQKRLAFASKRPGCTQYINFFQLCREQKTIAHLVDLPGYGYAKIDVTKRAHWNKLLSSYLQTRSQLTGLIIMMDIRRPFTELDHTMLKWYLPCKKPVHILLTKADKLSCRAAKLALNATIKLVDEYLDTGSAHNQLSVQLFSSLKKIGVTDAVDKIKSWLQI